MSETQAEYNAGSRDVHEGEVQFWRRANITAGDLARVRGIALNLANIVYQEHKDANIRAEIAELRKILGGTGGEKDKG